MKECTKKILAPLYRLKLDIEAKGFRDVAKTFLCDIWNIAYPAGKSAVIRALSLIIHIVKSLWDFISEFKVTQVKERTRYDYADKRKSDY